MCSQLSTFPSSVRLIFCFLTFTRSFFTGLEHARDPCSFVAGVGYGRFFFWGGGGGER